MKFLKNILIFGIGVCLVLCIGGCANQSGSNDEEPSGWNKDGFLDGTNNTPVPDDAEEVATGGAVVTGGAVATSGAVTTGSAVTSDGAVGDGKGVSSGAIGVSDGMATDAQKEEYSKLSERMEELYGILIAADSEQMEENSYEDFRYFEPIYEYYHGIREEKCENIKEDDMERILKGIEEYLSALEEFAKGHGIEVPPAG